MQLSAPCEWEALYVNCAVGDLNELRATLGAETFTAIENTAIEYLWNWTGRQFGLCDVTVQPCIQGCSLGNATRLVWRPGYRLAFRPPTPDPCCGSRCSCGGDKTMLRLPGPINSVRDIIIDGMPITAYEIVNQQFVRIDRAWPTCGTADVEITYQYGTPVPYGGRIAAGVFAYELALSMCNDDRCQLPTRMKRISRQGVDIELIDQFEGIEVGKTGLWQVDSWVQSIRHLQRPGKIYSPDRPAPGPGPWPVSLPPTTSRLPRTS